MKRIAIIGTVGVPGRYGGFETLAHQLVNNLADDFEIKVYCSKHAYTKNERPRYFNKARLYYLPFNANGIQSIIYDFISIIHALFVADTLVILGVSGGLLLPLVRLFTRKKIIVNIDGLEWRRAKWNKFAKKFLRFSERVAVRWSHADITDNEAIKRYTSIHYQTLSQLIEYGADHAKKVEITEAYSKKYSFIHQPYAFKVARIEPENNIHVVLETFASLSQKLVIVGNWEASEYGKKLKDTYKKCQNIYIIDPIYNQTELDVLRSNCLLYVHGHSAGGTNPSLVEAMYLALPVLAFDCAYNRATTEGKALYFKDSRELAQLIKTNSISEIMEMKSAMREIALERYTWHKIATKYKQLINAFDYRYKKQEIVSQLSKMSTNWLQHHELSHLKNPTKYYEEPWRS
jgi:glycosyltransferase involved in cell wall biosynthesis